MRWVFPDPDAAREARERQAVAEAMERFWEELLAGRDPAPWLRQVHPGIELEVAAAERVVRLSPGSSAWLRPWVDELASRLPQCDWRVETWAPPLSFEEAQARLAVQAGVDLGRVGFAVTRARHRMLDLAFDVPPQVGLAVAELLLGEERVARWVGSVRQVQGPGLVGRLLQGGKTGMRPVVWLAEAVAAHVAGLRAVLPDRPLHREPDRAPEILPLRNDKSFPDRGRCDMDELATVFPEMALAVLERPDRFHSSRFSAVGELFAWLKLEGSSQADEVEGMLDGRLATLGCGRVVGCGRGARWSFVDLALDDVPASVRLIREILRSRNVTRRSWLLFHDPELEREWVGVWPDAPGPP